MSQKNCTTIHLFITLTNVGRFKKKNLLFYSTRNLQQNLCYIAHQILDVLLHYLTKRKRTEIGEILLYLTQWHLLNVHKINKQHTQDNLCIIVVELNARKVFLSHKFTRRDICATHQLRHRWCFAWNDARHRSSAASVPRRHELVRHAAAFLPFFVVNRDQICAVGSQRLVKWTQVSRFRRLIVPRAGWAGTLPWWKIKNSPQISCMISSSFWGRSTLR